MLFSCGSLPCLNSSHCKPSEHWRDCKGKQIFALQWTPPADVDAPLLTITAYHHNSTQYNKIKLIYKHLCCEGDVVTVFQVCCGWCYLYRWELSYRSVPAHLDRLIYQLYAKPVICDDNDITQSGGELNWWRERKGTQASTKSKQKSRAKSDGWKEKCVSNLPHKAGRWL